MSLLKSALTVSGLTLVSRVTGVIRDMLIARFFGASAETDAFYVAFRLPNMLRRLFAEGAFQQAFVPMLADVKERSEGEAGTFIDHVFTVLALSVFAASILGVVAAPLLVWAIASGLASAPKAFDLASALTRFMFPYIAFMALTALAASVLNTWKRFAVPAVTPVLLNRLHGASRASHGRAHLGACRGGDPGRRTAARHPVSGALQARDPGASPRASGQSGRR